MVCESTLDSSFSYLINDYSKLTSRLAVCIKAQNQVGQDFELTNANASSASPGDTSHWQAHSVSKSQTQLQRQEKERAHESCIIYIVPHTAHIAALQRRVIVHPAVEHTHTRETGRLAGGSDR